MTLLGDDKAAIQELLARRSQAADFADADAWAATWTADGVLELPEGTVLNVPGVPRWTRASRAARISGPP